MRKGHVRMLMWVRGEWELAKLPWRLGELTMKTGLPESIDKLIEVGNHKFLVVPA